MSKAGALAVLLVCWSSAALAAPMTSAEYARIVDRAADAFEQATEVGQSGMAGAQLALKQIPTRIDVRLTPGGAVIHVDNRKLLRQLWKDLSGGAKGVRAAARTLRNLESGIVAAPPSPLANAGQALREVLARREFRESWLERMKRLFYDWLLRLLASITSRFPKVALPAKILAIIAWAVLSIAGLVIIVAGLRLLTRPRRRARGAPAPRAIVRLTHADWLEQAAKAAESGDYRTAVRAVHMAALARLDEAGMVSFDSAATDSRFVRMLRERGQHEVAVTLEALNRLFALIWYGSAHAREPDYLAAQARWGELKGMTAT